MIIKKEIKTFVCLAETKSYKKASDRLYITPTAVMKHINSLESCLGVRLIIRTNQGITLTESGNEFYKKCCQLIALAKDTVSELQDFDADQKISIKIGNSMLNPTTPFTNEFLKHRNQLLNYKLQIVPYSDSSETIFSYIDRLGSMFDFLVVAVDSHEWLNRCNILPIGRFKFDILLSFDHPLAEKECIDIEDLYGETIMIVYKGQSPSVDRARAILEKHPEITIESVPHGYDMSQFNECAKTHKLLLSHEGFKNIHPSLVSVPFNWELSIPYGLLYSLSPSKKVQQFIKEWCKICQE